MRFKKYFKESKTADPNKLTLVINEEFETTVTESVGDMKDRCEKCNTLLNDMGTCPKCDDGEEDYGDELKEELSVREKLMRAFPGEFNFDTEPLTETVEEASLSNKEKLMRAFPGVFNFDTTMEEGLKDTVKKIFDKPASLETQQRWEDELNGEMGEISDKRRASLEKKFARQRARSEEPTNDPVNRKASKGASLETQAEWEAELNGEMGEISDKRRAELERKFADQRALEANEQNETVTEEFSNVEKLKAAYPELNLETPVTEAIEDEYSWADDDYDIDDDIEQDRRHAALYGGDRTYCSCGEKFEYDEGGKYCPRCNPEYVDGSQDRTCEAEECKDNHKFMTYDDEM